MIVHFVHPGLHCVPAILVREWRSGACDRLGELADVPFVGSTRTGAIVACAWGHENFLWHESGECERALSAPSAGKQDSPDLARAKEAGRGVPLDISARTSRA